MALRVHSHLTTIDQLFFSHHVPPVTLVTLQTISDDTLDLIPNRKQHRISEASEGYVFTGICHSVTEQGEETPDPSWDRSHGHTGGGQKREGSVTTPSPAGHDHNHLPRVPPSHRMTPPDRTHTGTTVYAHVGSTHPTGMHSCF